MRRSQTQIPAPGAVTIRRSSERDREALLRLAERDSSAPLEGEALVADVEGEVLAAISLESGAVVADPFSRSGELRSLLELRAMQVRARRDPAGSRRPAPGRRPAGALAGSPPGAGGRLLTLLPRF